jgi:hypothetical protein
LKPRLIAADTGKMGEIPKKKKATRAGIDRVEKGFTVAGSHDGFQVH